MSTENIGNPVKKLREALGLNQVDFARAIGRSYPSVQGYEAGKRVPREVVEKMQALAAKNGLADLAIELSSQEWQVRRVLVPGEVLISQEREKIRSLSAKKSVDFRAHKVENSLPLDDRQAYHQMLDRILDSQHKIAIAAVIENLLAFDRLVTVDQPKAATRKKNR